MKEVASNHFPSINESWKVFAAAIYKDSYVRDPHLFEVTFRTLASEFWNEAIR